jgi:predicted ribosome quality control (RQC) complex YloA/Tae2 family protein
MGIGGRRTIEKVPEGVKPLRGWAVPGSGRPSGDAPVTFFPMSIRWDPLLASALARELDRELRGARVRALLLDGEARRVLLFLREGTLVLELHPLRGWVSLLPAVEPPDQARPLAAKVRAVEAPPDESALIFGLQRIRGKDEGVELVVEVIGNRWNALVVGHRSRTIRHVLVPRDDRDRSLRVGSAYEPPPSTGREGIEEPPDTERWNELLAAGDDPRRALLRGVAWASSLNAQAFLGPGGRDAWLAARDPESWGAWLLETAKGPQPYPVALPPETPELPEPRSVDSLLEALRLAREADEATGPEEALLLPPGLLDRGDEEVRRARRRLEALRRELEGAGDPEPVRAVGDLLLARFGEIPRGRDRVTLKGFQGDEVEVELDPALSPHENAARYYDEAARMERARAALPARIRKAEQALAEWEGLLAGVRSGDLPPERLAERLGPDRRQGRGGRPGEAPTLPYRRFTSSGGLEIRVGRGARSNDDLTFRHSAPDDVWLHARQAPGAHVILRWGRDEAPPRRDLAEAAVLAALHSEARHSGSVPVDWTWRKYVRKPRKAAPGAVIPDRVQTLFVEPDPKVAEALGGGE